jgi:hypothetical protein
VKPRSRSRGGRRCSLRCCSGSAVGAQESSREEIASDIGRGATYVVISDDQRRVTVTVKPSRHDLNYLHAFPDGAVRDRILDLPTYP